MLEGSGFRVLQPRKISSSCKQMHCACCLYEEAGGGGGNNTKRFGAKGSNNTTCFSVLRKHYGAVTFPSLILDPDL